MQRFESNIDLPGGVARKATSLGGILLFCWLAGCGTSTTDKTAASTASSPTYFAPYIQGVSDAESPQTFTIDDAAGSFSQIIYQPQNEAGLQVLNSGTLTVGQRGLRSLTITVNYAYSNETGAYEPNTTPEVGSFAVELAGQAGGLVQLVAQPAEPVVAATQCPGSSTQTYQFITIPTAASPTFLTETAYGSVDISSSGSDVTFKNIHQHTLPSAGGTGAPAQPSASTVSDGVCGPTFFGDITTVPGKLVVTDPGLGSELPAQAEIGIGSSGLLVENNGYPSAMANTLPAIGYENVLGAGTGAVGLPEPSSALDTGSIVGAQYLGFIYAAGVGSPYLPWSSHLASFGFSSMPSSCASVPASTSPSAVIYGGDFPQSNGQDNPSASPDGFGNCDFAIDLGSQDSNGLYSNAIVWVYPGYAGNTTGKRYSFPAVAIAGQLNGKYAVFLIGYDSTQPWAVYLLQSNN
jgi:hypothetical protein